MFLKFLLIYLIIYLICKCLIIYRSESVDCSESVADLSGASAATIASLRQACQIQSLLENDDFEIQDVKLHFRGGYRL